MSYSYNKRNQLSFNYALISAIVLSFYGIAVCPYIDSLPNTTVVVIFVLAFIVHGLVLGFFNIHVVDSTAIEKRSARQFFTELSVYIATGVILTLFNYLVLNFPLESGLKVITGCIAIGVFASMDSSLLMERRINADGIYLDVKKRFFPVAKKLAAFFSIIMLLLAIIMALIIHKDTEYLITEYANSPDRVIRAFYFDVIFLVGIFLIFSLRVLFSFSVNLKMLFGQQLSIMDQVKVGDLSAKVPVASHDEFALIAQHTNEMIDGLRDKEKIHSTLGKVVSPYVARHLLNNDPDKLRRGATLDVVVLMCDIRGFTRLSESMTAVSVVEFLNDYFTDIVSVIDKHHGVVDKFMGDAVLAVFGLENPSIERNVDAINMAVQAALEINDSFQSRRLPSGELIEHGIGLHAGQVVAGTIGSPQRFEFTVIGDTVNTASRIEGLCKRIGSAIVLSDTVYEAMNASMQARFKDYGCSEIRGRQGEVHIYGLQA